MKNAVEERRESAAKPAAPDARAELEALRRETARYRGLFDSARLIVGHEFGRPLTAATGYLDLLEERAGGALDDRGRAYVARIRDALGRMSELVDSFVEMLRAENAAADPRSAERFDFRALAEAVRGRFERGGGRIVLDVPADLPPIVASRRCVEIVLENLVSNALKHGGESPVVVAASLSPRRRGDGDALLVTVEDRGAGIPEDKIDDIFAPFYRIEDGERREGLGLGLALVKSIVAVVGGDISVRSGERKGTAVTVAVPVMGVDRSVGDTVG